MHDSSLNSFCNNCFRGVWFAGCLRVKKSQKATRAFSPNRTTSVKKQRADALLLARGFACSRQRARDLIADGAVLVDGIPIVKPSKLLETDCDLELTSSGNPWVSRAGLKLSGGLKAFPMVDVAGRYAIDIGASTGGFTDVLLAKNVGHVLAVDVGSRQLAEKIATNPRVTVMDATNARHLAKNMLAKPVELIVCDASFISLKKLLPAAMNLAAAGAYIMALIKPQFEARREQIGSKGVVRDTKVHEEVIQNVIEGAKTLGYEYINHTVSPIKGAKEGNTEFLGHFRYQE